MLCCSSLLCLSEVSDGAPKRPLLSRSSRCTLSALAFFLSSRAIVNRQSYNGAPTGWGRRGGLSEKTLTRLAVEGKLSPVQRRVLGLPEEAVGGVDVDATPKL